MSPTALVNLPPLMGLTNGNPQIRVGLIDGPVFKAHPDLSAASIHEIGNAGPGSCSQNGSMACMHGTFVAGILSARRTSLAPAICPDCTLLVRPIFSESMSENRLMPSATPDDLAGAINDCINEGARVINLSAGLAHPSTKGERALDSAFDYALRRGVIVVAAAGNQAAVGSSAITRHPWVIPVVSYDLQGRPLNYSNFGSSIGKGGLGAPGESITSLSTNGQTAVSGGTSVAAPFVTGAIALVWSEFPDLPAFKLKLAVTSGKGQRRTTVVPPLLDAWAAYQVLKMEQERNLVAS